ncbi:MAG: TrmB family transcriptional regulator [Halalkalicoccus sp.]
MAAVSEQMDTEALKTSLRRAGLTQYEADAYVTVVDLGTASATEIADACDVPQARIYDVLRELEADEYIETFQDGSLKARPRDPADLIETLETQASEITDAASEIDRRFQQPVLETNTVSVVKRRRTVEERAAKAIASATNEIEMAVTPGQFAVLEGVLRDAIERDVLVKLTITEGEGAADLAREGEFSGVATAVRYRRLPTPFLVVADRTTVCFAPEPDLRATSEYGVLVEDYSLSRVFDWFFQTALWEPWERVYSSRGDGRSAVYTNIRECIRDVRAFVDAGDEVRVTVYGHERGETGRREFSGRIVGTTYTENGGPSLLSFVKEATIEIETDDGERYDVGGWGVLFEDIEASRIVVDSID